MSETGSERLHKVLARAGVASRRKSEQLIEQGRVTVNGRVVTQLGTKVDPARDRIAVDGQSVQVSAGNVYIMLNKPAGVLSTMRDSRGRQALGDLVNVPERLYPVGRLDAQSEGLILLTDDGDLAYILTHPRYEHDKEYRVLLGGQLSDDALQSWRQGVSLEGKVTAPAQVEILHKQRESTLVRVVMHEGRKRQIRNVAQLLGHVVQELVRTRLGPLELGVLDVGQWRYLTSKEIRSLHDIKRRALKNKRSSQRPRGRRR